MLQNWLFCLFEGNNQFLFHVPTRMHIHRCILCMFSHTFLKFSSCLGYIWAARMTFFFFPFNFYFCYSRQKISENQFWAETGNKRSLDIFFFHVFSVDFLTEWTLILTLIFAVWWGSFHFDQLHVSVINTSRILQI